MNVASLLFIVTLYNSNCQPVHQYKADTVTLLQRGVLIIELDGKKPEIEELTSDTYEIRIQADQFVMYHRKVNGVWQDYRFSSCGQI